MRYYEEGTRFATLRQALENHTIDELKKLLALCQTSEWASRKGAIIDILVAQMQGDNTQLTIPSVPA